MPDGYSFTTDWFSDNIPVWKQVLADLAGRPGIYGLEIGSYEGRSACWLLDNIFTHPTARLRCVDPWPDAAVRARFDANVGDRAALFVGTSEEFLCHPRPDPLYDFVYIDGNHNAAMCLQDLVMVWPRLRGHGIVVVDDVGGGDPSLPTWTWVRTATDAFLACYVPHYDVVHRAYQLVLRKRA